MGFTKLDSGILQSSIMAEDSDTFKVWIALLAACGPDGVARIAPPFLSAVCRLAQEVVDRALDTLAAPDKYSRSRTEDGRRLRLVDGGFFIINYRQYRENALSDSTGAKRQRRFREKKKEEAVTRYDVTESNGNASASASASSSESEKQKPFKPVDPRFNPFIAVFDSVWKSSNRQGAPGYVDRDFVQLKGMLSRQAEATEAQFKTACVNCIGDQFHAQNFALYYVASKYPVLVNLKKRSPEKPPTVSTNSAPVFRVL